MDKDRVKTLLEERRLRIVSLDPLLLVAILNWAQDPKEALALPVTAATPLDCVVVSANTCWDRGTIDVIVAHERFGKTPPGSLITRLTGMVTELRRVSLKDVLEVNQE